MKRHILLSCLAALSLLPMTGQAEDKALDLSTDWKFFNGSEFPGATGNLETSVDDLQLSYDFNGGGAYVAAIRPLEDETEVTGVTVKLSGPGAPAVRLTDATGQSFVYRLGPVGEDEETHELDLSKPNQVYGGADDKTLHHPLKAVAILSFKDPAQLAGVITVKEVLLKTE